MATVMAEEQPPSDNGPSLCDLATALCEEANDEKKCSAFLMETNGQADDRQLLLNKALEHFGEATVEKVMCKFFPETCG